MTWLLSLVPWWAYLIGGVALAAVAYRLLGWKGVLAVVATTAGVTAYSRGAQKGIEIERAKQDKADDTAREVIAGKKAEVRVITPAERSERFSRWEKPS